MEEVCIIRNKLDEDKKVVKNKARTHRPKDPLSKGPRVHPKDSLSKNLASKELNVVQRAWCLETPNVVQSGHPKACRPKTPYSFKGLGPSIKTSHYF
ncbi:hypothetical protein CR513_08957, partial [Mucuna pruriens]